MPYVFFLSLDVCLGFFKHIFLRTKCFHLTVSQLRFRSNSWSSPSFSWQKGWLLHNDFLTGGIHTVLAKTGEAGEVIWLTGPWGHHQAWLSVTITLWPSPPCPCPRTPVQCSLMPMAISPYSSCSPALHSPAQTGHGHCQARPHLRAGPGLAPAQPHGPGSPHHTWSWDSLWLPHSVLEINTKMWKQRSVCPEHLDPSSESNNYRKWKCNKWVCV